MPVSRTTTNQTVQLTGRPATLPNASPTTRTRLTQHSRMLRPVPVLAAVALLTACSVPLAESAAVTSREAYFDTTGRTDIESGGVRMIPVSTPKGTFKVWTKRVGNNPTIKVLLLHGGPGFTHDYWEAADSYFPGASVEYYDYDQLGSMLSDQPKEPDLWETARFVEEVEQVRVALGLDSSNFYIMGHSWGGILGMEYALKYQRHLKGLIISNMMASIPAYNEYAKNTLMPAMDQSVLAEVKALEARQDYANPRYMELLVPNHYETHVLRRPFADLPKITVPTLVIAGTHDTMDPAHMEMMSRSVQRGRYLLCPHSGHMPMYDDQAMYFGGAINFLRDVDRSAFK